MSVPFSSRRSVVALVHSARRLVAPDFELRECLRWMLSVAVSFSEMFVHAAARRFFFCEVFPNIA